MVEFGKQETTQLAAAPQNAHIPTPASKVATSAKNTCKNYPVEEISRHKKSSI